MDLVYSPDLGELPSGRDRLLYSAEQPDLRDPPLLVFGKQNTR